jgi:glycosyltransferase involved in cell wall biosynthesis/SAM-dependent methyltransferase
VVGGAELHARSLERVLREAGHEAEIVSMPFKWYPSLTILDHILAARAMDVSEFNGVKIDLAICLKFPAYLMQHPNKTFWILHQHRQSYDLWDSGDSDLFNDESGQLVREAIREFDNAELGSASRIFANSANVAKRLLRYNNIVAEPLYHPPPLAHRLTCGDFGDYFYYPSRISASKRQDLVLRALARASRNVRVIFSGAPDNPEYGKQLERLAHQLHVEDRVEWKGFVTDAEMIDLYAQARGILFTPVDEDLGYVALEAMLAGKPLLTLSDAGEPATLVRDEIEGFVVEPQPDALADVMSRLAASKELACGMGASALAHYRSLEISWPNVVAKLTEAQISKPIRPRSSEPITERSILRRTAPSSIDLEERLAQPDWLKPNSPHQTHSIDDLMGRYRFGDHVTRHRAYYETHWPRFQATLAAIAHSGVRVQRVLELGSSEPYVFTALLKSAYPDAEFNVIQESPAGLTWQHTIKSRDSSIADINITVCGLNVETTRLPFADDEFDLVIAMEILEHLTIDPSFMFSEANRVLRENGAFLVTTPNLVSLQAMSRALNGASPYTFGVFVPWNGVYGRHNREYTPVEVDALGRYAGFDTFILDTVNIYLQEDVPQSLLWFMLQEGRSLDLRGQNIFYVGHKNSNNSRSAYPESLFPIDPAIFSGELELLRRTSSHESYIVRAVNKSPVVWPASGPYRVRLTVDRIDQNGLVTFDALAFALPDDIEPGRSVEIPIKATIGSNLRGCWHEIGLYAENAGPFKGTGRMRPVCIFAERLDAAPNQLDDGDAA